MGQRFPLPLVAPAAAKFSGNASVETASSSAFTSGRASVGQTVQPTAAHFQANFLPQGVLPFRKPAFGSTSSSQPDYLKKPVPTSYDEVPTEELWKMLVEGATENPDVARHFCFTPPEVVDEMVKSADIKRGDKVLEPSAGTGNIVLPAALASDNVDAIEQFPILQVLLKCGAIRPGLESVSPALVDMIRKKQPKFTLLPDADFLQVPTPASDNEKYDKVLMSSPFGGPELQHFNKAMEMLKPGGTMVAILPAYALSNLSSGQTKSLTLVGPEGEVLMKETESSDETPNQDKQQLRSKKQGMYKAFRQMFEQARKEGRAEYIGAERREVNFLTYELDKETGAIKENIKPLQVRVIKITKPKVEAPVQPEEMPTPVQAGDSNVVSFP